MKRLFTLLLVSFVAMSCEQIQDFIDDKGHGLVFLEGEMKAYFDDKGDTKNYKFKADLAWSAEVSADWVEVNPTSGPAGENKIQIKVDKNKSDEKRTGYVDITLSNDKSYRIELEQLAAGENIDDVIPSISIPSNEIWYTSADGNIVGPYSGEGSQDNFTVFGANIVSNEYDTEKECWVIKFDGDVTSIGYAAFYGCSSLTSVTIPDGVTTIGEYAFFDCSSLTEFNGKFASEDGRCLIIDGTLNSFAPAGLTEYTIPDGVTAIGEWAFGYCSSLTSVTIGDSVTTIGDYAFRFCSSLTSVTIPDSVTEMGNGVFIGCCSLTRFNGKFTSDNGRCLIVDGTFNSFAPAGLTEYTIPDSVTTIGQDAFAYCSSLTSVTIGNSVIQIGGNAFYDCQNIQAVYISDLLAWCNINFECHLTEFVSIAANPLYCGANLYLNGEVVTDLVVPDGVTEIRMMSFFGCSSLTSITIPDSVTEIGYAAFAGCSRLTIAYCKSVTPPTALFDNRSYLWNGFSQNAIYVPMESVEAYKAAEGWSEYADRIVGYDFENGCIYTPESTPATKVWLGDWSAYTEQTINIETGEINQKRTDFTFNVSVVDGYADRVYVDGLSVMGKNNRALGYCFESEDGGYVLYITNQYKLAYLGDGYSATWLGYWLLEDGLLVPVSGDYPPVYFIMDANGNISAELFAGSLVDGRYGECVAFDIISVNQNGNISSIVDENGDPNNVWKCGDIKGVTKIESPSVQSKSKSANRYKIGDVLPHSMVVASL